MYPARFRREYGDGMLEAFRDLRQHTARGPLAFWLFVAADTPRAASAERALACRDLLQSSRCRLSTGALAKVEWMTACAAGATACGALGSLVTWAFSYFYHPYLVSRVRNALSIEGGDAPGWQGAKSENIGNI